MIEINDKHRQGGAHGRFHVRVRMWSSGPQNWKTSLLCCDKEFSEKDEDKRKILHDAILSELGMNQQTEYSWGKISSDYAVRSNISSIDIMYF